MARSRIKNPTIQLNNDDGTQLISMIRGEQQIFPVTYKSFADISSWEVEAVCLHAIPTDETNPIPTLEVDPDASMITLPTAITAGTNMFTLTVPETLGAELDEQPTVDQKRYYLFGVKVQDGSDATKTQVFKDVRGVIELLFTVTSVT